ncbi:NAD-dependent epimerase/dehydratase family protein [Methylophaga sp.]|uniref:NAD-dependent epimerase/dehydratase family protein n=1 Tax=Methylophaga sp. TaxID=2024840 RepID=UPI003A8CB56E
MEALKKVLITGGRGFLAKTLSQQLRERYRLVVCDRATLNLNDSVKVEEYLDKQKFDVVIHTATYDAAPKDTLNDPDKVLEQNLHMFFNLARCRDSFGKMLYFGSGAEFGRDNWTENMDESFFDRQVPTDQYGYSKYLMTQFALNADNIYNLRLFGVFGELDNWRYRFISNICAHAVLALPIKVHQNSRMDFLYVDDLTEIVSWFIENKPLHNVYNVCRGKAYEFVDLAKQVQAIANVNVDLVVNHNNINKRYSGSNSRLLHELPNFNFTSMQESLSKMLTWYEDNKGILDAKQLHF